MQQHLLSMSKKNIQKDIRIKGGFKSHLIFTKTTIFCLIQKRKSHFTENIHIKRRIVFSGVGRILLENHIKAPMKLIFDRPMLAYRIGKFSNICQ